jgi:TolA-binding protein
MTGTDRTSKVLAGLVVCLVFGTLGCSVYFNTFFNAKKAFNAAEKARRASPRASAGQREYQEAIVKCLKVVEDHPKSKYYDDAVYILGVSYYHTQQYGKAERRFREYLADYPNGKKAREANVYLAKSKLALGDMDDAMATFGQVFVSKYDKEYKAEAAMALGNHLHETKDYSAARNYFLAVRDSLGDDLMALEAQSLVGDGYFEQFQFRDALSAYLQILGMNPSKEQKYHALYQAALCSFRLQRIEDGLAYLDQLAGDPLYFDSLGILKLTMAEGYEYDDDLLQAEVTYQDVAETSSRKPWQAMAYYRLGLIYQLDYDQLGRAKEYYDQAAQTDRATPISSDAIMRSSDIGKLETFTRTTLDSTATPAAIDEAAYSQYLLAELYWLKLDKPDSAMLEMRYLVDSFATSYYAPKAMISLAEMTREQSSDDATADSLLKSMLRKYPQSDFAPDALEALGLKGTAADTGYAAIYVDKAEDFMLNGENYDSARAYYQLVVNRFPESEYYVPSKFALIWLEETYASPGDSSVYYAYKEFADSFPGNEWANVALRRTGAAPAARSHSDERLANRRREELDSLEQRDLTVH